MSIRFYALDAEVPLATIPALPPDYTVSDWRPSRDGAPPSEIRSGSNRVWWLFDRLGIFSNRHCGVLMIKHTGKLVHTSLVTPRWFRFPEMAANDIQIGATWTDPAHRRRGLAIVAIMTIHGRWNGQFGRIWYLVDDENMASVNVIEHCGYRLVAEGKRTRPLKLALFGRFVAERRFD